MRGTWRRSINGISMRNLVLLVCLFCLLSGIAAGPSSAQTPVQTIERSVKVLANKDTQIGIYLNVRADCTSGPLPTIRLVSSPASGKVVVKTAKVKATNFKACLALEVPGYVAFYKSAPDFLGADTLTIEVSFPEGRTEIQKFTINVGGAGAQQKI
jgi:hypothetical protein